MTLRSLLPVLYVLVLISSARADNQYASNGADVHIPDAGPWVSSAITISGAPAGAVVTAVDVSFRCVHSYSGDLFVELRADSQGTQGSYPLWSREGQGQDNPSRTVGGVTVFNGLSANRTWYLAARDAQALDAGYINDWSIRVYYSAPPPPSNPPVIYAVSPNPAPASWTAQTVTILGDNFASECKVSLVDLSTGTPYPDRPTTYISRTEVRITPVFGDTTAYWTAVVRNPDGASSIAFAFLVLAAQASAPPAPTNLRVNASDGGASPPGVSISTTIPTLSWSASPGATRYGIAVSKFPYGEPNIEYEFNNIAGTSHTVPLGELAPGVAYRWDAVAYDSSGRASARSVNSHFQIQAAPPPPPPAASIVPPTDLRVNGLIGGNAAPGVTVATTTPLMTWTPSTNAFRYGLFIRREPFTGPMDFEDTQITGPSKLVPEGRLVSGVNYRWNMVAYNTAGIESPISSTYYFRVETGTPPPPPPSGAAPGPFTVSLAQESPYCDRRDPVGPALKLTWTASSGATSFRVARDGVPIPNAASLPLSPREFINNAGLVAGRSYTYTVFAVNSAGSTPSSLTVSIPADICSTTPPPPPPPSGSGPPRIAGTVTDSAGLPLARAQVRFGIVRVNSNAQGRYTLAPSRACEVAALSVTLEGYATVAESSYAGPCAGTQTRDFVLARPAPDQNSILLTGAQPWRRGFSGDPRIERYFTLNVPAGVRAVRFTAYASDGRSLAQASRADLYVSRGARATTAAEYRSVTNSNRDGLFDTVVIRNPLPGEYSLLVRATRKYTFGSIYADLVMNDGQMETDAESVPGPFVADNSLMTAIRLRMEGLGTLSPPSDPNREIWLFIHGRNDSPGLVGSSTYSNPMGRLIRAVQAAESIHSADPLTLALDWSEGARDNDNRGPDDNAATRFGGSRWIPTVAEWAAGELLMRGIEGPQLRVVAHSWGTYVAHLIGVRMKEIPVYDGSSGATLSTSKMLAALCAIDPAESVANYIGTSWVGSPQPKDTNYTLSAAMSWAFLTSVWAGDKPVVRSAHSSLDAGVQGANTRDSHSNGLELLASAMERLRQGPPDADDSLLRECSLMMLGGDAPGTFAGLSNSGSRDGTLDGVLFGAREAIRGSYGSGGPEEEVWRPVSLYQLDTRGRAKLDTFQGAAPRSFNLTRSAAVSLAPGQSSRAVVDRAVTQLWFRVDNPQGLERIILDSHGPGDTPDLLVGFGTPDPRSPLINLPLLEVESQNGRRVLTLRNPAPAGRALWFQVKAPARDVGVLFTLTPGSAP